MSYESLENVYKKQQYTWLKAVLENKNSDTIQSKLLFISENVKYCLII